MMGEALARAPPTGIARIYFTVRLTCVLLVMPPIVPVNVRVKVP